MGSLDFPAHSQPTQSGDLQGTDKIRIQNKNYLQLISILYVFFIHYITGKICVSPVTKLSF